MKKFLVIGNPIDHSLSPKLHNYWIKQNNINATYEKQKLDEKDLLKMCVDNPKYLSKALGHEEDTTGLVSLDEKKEMLSYFYKSWSGLTKFIYR